MNNAANTGSNNTALGSGTLAANTASNNTAVGYQSLAANTTGTSNVAVGYQSLAANTIGINNTAVGYQALDSCTTGISNVAVGKGTLTDITTGDGTIGIGPDAGGTLATGTSNIHIGVATLGSASNVNREIVIGCTAGSSTTGKGSNTGYIQPNGGGVYQGNNSSSWSTTSDRRLKKNIVDNNEGLDVVSQIRVRNFEYRLPEEVDAELKPQDAIQKTGIQLGVIAQELQEVCPDCVKEETTGVLSVDSDNVFWHMVNAIKQLNTRLQAAEAEIATLKGA